MKADAKSKLLERCAVTNASVQDSQKLAELSVRGREVIADMGVCSAIQSVDQWFTSHHVVKLIEAENLSFTAHTWSSALNTAASVHLLASSTHGLTMDFKPHESPMQHELVSNPWVQKDGYLEVRQLPGLGITVNEEVVAKYAFS
jgi:endo-1,4-beta-D-glucanase Y